MVVETQAGETFVSLEQDRKFPVVEIFGPTLQGEGAMIGVPTHFIRFGGCDYKCGFNEATGEWRKDGWVCDSLHAVLPKHVRLAPKLTAGEIITRLIGLKGSGLRWVTFSGGNPLLHELGSLVKRLHDSGMSVAVETQGTLFKTWVADADVVTVSPKPPSTFQPFDMLILDRFLAGFEGRSKVNLKIVIWDEDDLGYATSVRRRYPRVPMFLSVCNDWQKPETNDDLLARLRWMQETIIDRFPLLHDVPITPQLHVLLWGNDRGR
jgi:7-carboxy-7-deazaguanine synthase